MIDTRTIPTININGTNADHLIEALISAAEAIRKAQRAIDNAGPAQRDYPNRAADFAAARRANMKRIITLAAVEEEIEQLASGVEDQQRAKANGRD